MKSVNKTIYLIMVFAALIASTSCSHKNPSQEKTQNTNLVQQEQSNNQFNQIDTINAKSINDSKSWIETTKPLDGQIDVNSESNISIKFKCDIDENTLNKDNIFIREGKHDGVISNLFNYKYDKASRVLDIVFKEAGNGVGSSNGVTVYISHKIKNIQGHEMGIDVRFGYMTK